VRASSWIPNRYAYRQVHASDAYSYQPPPQVPDTQQADGVESDQQHQADPAADIEVISISSRSDDEAYADKVRRRVTACRPSVVHRHYLSVRDYS
jgi:hypothetical protein